MRLRKWTTREGGATPLQTGVSADCKGALKKRDKERKREVKACKKNDLEEKRRVLITFSGNGAFWWQIRPKRTKTV